MFENIINSNSHKNMKSNLLNKLQSSKKRNMLNIIIDECANIDQKHRAKFSNLTKHDLFRAWTFENMTNQRHVISKNIMKIIEKRVSTLINHLKNVAIFKRIQLNDFVFQIIMKLILNDSSNLWINIFFMLCYIYRFQTCTRWSTLMSV
jgi:L-lactate utilization protein LutC